MSTGYTAAVYDRNTLDPLYIVESQWIGQINSQVTADQTWRLIPTGTEPDQIPDWANATPSAEIVDPWA